MRAREIAAKQAEIDAAVAAVVSELAPDVVRIRYNIGEDHTGDPSIFFRIVLSDNATTPRRFRKTTRDVEARLEERVDPDQFGLFPYFNFRSRSETEALRE